MTSELVQNEEPKDCHSQQEDAIALHTEVEERLQKGKDEFKNMEQQELFSSEKAMLQDGGEFSKFKIQTLTPAPVCKDDSFYLPPSCCDLPDLHTLYTCEKACRICYFRRVDALDSLPGV